MDHVSLAIVLICTGVKLLLFPSYRSTDFEVHRNWLAITHSKPLGEWYADGASASDWTLDYPPLFAWFEWALSQFAPYFDPSMLEIENLEYASKATIRFQRLSVVISEGLLLLATQLITSRWPLPRRRLALFLIAANPGLIIVDHIHFQYNGVLLGLFVLSIWSVSSGLELFGAALFAALLCSKHIFLYSAPPFFVFLLRYYCRGPAAILRFLLLGMTVVCVVGAALGPFIALGQGPQLLKRLFPVSRGLLHAYWAPNFWALYAAFDKALMTMLRMLGLNTTGLHPSIPTATLTGGIVGEASFALLPNAGSIAAALCTLAAMMPALVACWRRPLPGRFARCVSYCTLSSFVFGYHVHEKAILMVLIPLALIAAGGKDADAAKEYSFLSTVGIYALFPLLIRAEEYGIKVLLLVTYLLISLPWLRNPEYWDSIMEDSTASSSGSRKSKGGAAGRPRPHLLSQWERIYLGALIPLELYCAWGHELVFAGAMPFLPLLLTSVYCALGVMYCWARMARAYCDELGVRSHWEGVPLETTSGPMPRSMIKNRPTARTTAGTPAASEDGSCDGGNSVVRRRAPRGFMI